MGDFMHRRAPAAEADNLPRQGQRPLRPRNEKGSVLRDTLTSCQRDIA